MDPKDPSHQDTNDSSKAEPNSLWVDDALVRLHQALAATFLLELGLIGWQTYTFKTYPLTTLAYAKIFGWIASTISWTCLRSDVETMKGTKLHWIHYTFGWMALVGFSVLGKSFLAYCWNLIISGEFFETRMDVWTLFNPTKSIYEQAQLGAAMVRYSSLWIIGILSTMNLAGLLDMNDLKVPETFLKDSSTSTEKDEAQPTISASQKQRLKRLEESQKAEADAFKNFWRKTKLAIRLSYPWSEPRLKLLIFFKFLLTLLDRALNLLVPMQTERILQGFTRQGPEGGITKFDVWSVVLYTLYKYLQQYSSILSVVQRLIWEPVSEFSSSAATLRFFEHIHNQSMQFHMDHKSGELMTMMNSGVSSMQSVADAVFFDLIPTIADVVIAVIYFWVGWGWKYGIIVSASSVLYLVITYYTSKRRAQFQRQWIEVDDNSYSKAYDSIDNVETVKYFTAEQFEVSQYRKGLKKMQGGSFKISVTYELLDMLETIAWTLNSFIGCLLCAYEISKGERSVGSFMSFVVYTRQLEGPVDSLVWCFKRLRRDFVSMEKFLRLLEEQPGVKDIPDAKPLTVSGGEIVFDNVSFQYDANKKGLQNISFTVPKGKTVALVGPTGSGKSTILRLVFRFWDPKSGRILIDGQDIAEKTQKSIREQIGVVPQEAVLFDDSIMYNIHYGRVNATKEEIIDAAKAAQIHESILKFKDGYESLAGDRGAKMSGGEKQRIALARTILKNPPIILLDEATSALDTATESQIQSALAAMTKNRTTLVVAHRLSTIMNADLILVIKDGEIVERGTHEELIRKGMDNEGEYYKMWRIQSGEAARARAKTAVSDEKSDKETSDGKTLNEKETSGENSPDAKQSEQSPQENEPKSEVQL
ncbi:MAG: hypothetical protein J3Q66DRAFT_276004 [Benniella sp.]|nr:MAG: hypothetical protein J3Q66DRAFT_276004 [Benniella sp.]